MSGFPLIESLTLNTECRVAGTLPEIEPPKKSYFPINMSQDKAKSAV